MSYIALARKWRPRIFSQLVGQEHITKALINSLQQNRIHHAYLFTGTRGVGKTSIARLLAKALNCEQGISPEPCLTCEACIAVEQGSYVDLIEIDGASRTRVEDTRELLDNVQYAPTRGRYKIYLIDEVHMLSQHSFNALLKTLEEPPEHVKFLLATTDPQKLPVTVLSRCLQFNLKHLTPETICAQLVHVLQDEQFEFEQLAVELLANAAKGSMRDALSLLDQAMACADNTLFASDVKAILGYTQQDYAFALLQALSRLDALEMVTISRKIATEGGQFHYVAEEILNYLHQMAVIQTIPDANPLITVTSDMSILCSAFTPEDIQLFYQIIIKSINEMKLAPTLAIGFEMMLLRLYTFRPSTQKIELQLAYQNKIETHNNQPSYTTKAQQKLPLTEHTHTERPNPFVENISKDSRHPEPREGSPIRGEVSQDVGVCEPADNEIRNNSLASTPLPSIERHEKTHLVTNTPSLESWDQLLPELKLTGLALTAAENAELILFQDSVVKLRVAKGHLSLFTPGVIQRIAQGLTNYYKKVVKLELETQEAIVESPMEQRRRAQNKNQEKAEEALHADPFFLQLKQEFSAELEKDSASLLGNVAKTLPGEKK